MASETEEKFETLAAWTLVNTSLFGALVGALRASCAFTQAQINGVVDNALVGVENTPAITPEVSERARKILEEMAEQFGGERGSGD